MTCKALWKNLNQIAGRQTRSVRPTPTASAIQSRDAPSDRPHCLFSRQNVRLESENDPSSFSAAKSSARNGTRLRRLNFGRIGVSFCRSAASAPYLIATLVADRANDGLFPKRPVLANSLSRISSQASNEAIFASLVSRVWTPLTSPRICRLCTKGRLGLSRADHVQCPVRVKLKRTQCEQMSSGLPQKADLAQFSRHFAFVPKAKMVG
jgi:hypothetical protein